MLASSEYSVKDKFLLKKGWEKVLRKRVQRPRRRHMLNIERESPVLLFTGAAAVSDALNASVLLLRVMLLLPRPSSLTHPNSRMLARSFHVVTATTKLSC